MKKISALFLAVIIFCSSFAVTAFAESNEYPNKTEDIGIRDPYILVYEGKYYMYGTGVVGDGYGCYVSEDLENWSDPVRVFTPTEGFDGNGCYWAPECHYYNGNFYLFATYYSYVTGFRGTGIFKSSSPTGPFEQIGDGHITPHTRDCIDGTLYIDGEGQPWMVYVNEWTSDEDGIGDMAAAKLSEELDCFISEPIILFQGTDAIWADGNITDGPCLYRTDNGNLLMLWSNDSINGYAVGIAYSDNGEIDGKWYQQPIPLYEKNLYRDLEGGHPMIFTDLNGRELMVIHSPNYSDETIHETATFFEIEDAGDTIKLKEDFTGFDLFLSNITQTLIKIFYAFKDRFEPILELFAFIF